jgi:hypothetical protein
METLPDFIRVRLRQLAYDKPPPDWTGVYEAESK